MYENWSVLFYYIRDQKERREEKEVRIPDLYIEVSPKVSLFWNTFELFYR